MTPEERDLIEGVFERMRSVRSLEKDAEAESFINGGVRQIRDSAYMLVQTVVVQDQALQQSEERIQQLEEQVRQLEEAQQSKPASSGGGFLGGIFGGSRPAAPSTTSPWGSGSVPASGRQSPGYAAPAQGSPWASQPPQSGYAQPAPQAQQAGGGGGFMRSALATAAGVAGGMMVGSAIGNMMRGSHGTGSSSDGTSPLPGPHYQDSNDNDQGGSYTRPSPYQDASDNDQGTDYSSDAQDDAATDAEFEQDQGGWGGDGDIET